MKRFASDFLRRGLMACGFGPAVLVVVYMILQKTVGVHTLTVNQVCIGIASITLLAFVAGGMNAVYQLERLPLMTAILIHGGVLYVSYLATYVVNNWLEWSLTALFAFSGIFIAGYIAVWAVIYFVNKRKTARLNKMLREKQNSP